MIKTPLLGLQFAVAALFSAAALAADAPPPSYASYFDRLPCVDRIGRCFDATIGGKPVVVIATKARHEEVTKMAKDENDQVREVYWEVREPVESSKVFDIQVQPNAAGKPHIGEPKEEPDVTVYPLDDVELESTTETVARNDVRVGSQPVLTQQETLTQDALPPGRYVFAIKYRGTKNWERKQVYLTVKADPPPAAKK